MDFSSRPAGGALLLGALRRPTKNNATDIAAPISVTYIQVRFFKTRLSERTCPERESNGTTSSVCLIPSGVSSNAHAMTSAIGKPMIIASTISLRAQFGITKIGKNCVVTWNNSQQTTAYATAIL